MWVLDRHLDRIFTYKMSDKSHDSTKGFTTLRAAGNDDPEGLWSDGTTMWVLDSEDDKVYAYNMTSKARDPEREINVKTLIGNTVCSR